MKKPITVRLFCLLLGWVLLFSALGGVASALSPVIPDYQCGNFILETRDDAKTATIYEIRNKTQVVTIPCFLDGYVITGFHWLFSSGETVKEFRVEEGHLFLRERDGILYNHDFTQLVMVPQGYEGKLTIPEGVTTVRSDAVGGCTGITEIEFPSSLTNINGEAFTGCKGITSIQLPENLQWLGDKAFWNCTSLETIEIPHGVNGMGSSTFAGTAFYRNEENWENGMLYLGGCLLSADKFTGTVCEVKEGTRAIGTHAFWDNGAILEQLILPDSIEWVGAGDFYRVNPNAIQLPDKGISFANGMFTSQNSMPESSASPNQMGPHIFKIDSLEAVDGVAYIPDGVRTLNTQSIILQEEYDTLYIPASVEYIAPNLFGLFRVGTTLTVGKTMVKNFAVDPNNPNYTAVDGVLYTKDGKTLVCCPPAREQLDIPEGVTHIASNAFYFNQTLVRVKFPSTLQEIGSSAFYACYGLTQVEIPETVTTVAESAFYACNNLAKVTWNSSAPIVNLTLAEGGVLEVGKNVPYISYTAGYQKITLKVTKHTVAHAYAKRFNFPCTVVENEEPPTCGNPNGDREIDAKDALMVLKALVGKVEFTKEQEEFADVNGDGLADAKDALSLLKYVVGKPSAVVWRL